MVEFPGASSDLNRSLEVVGDRVYLARDELWVVDVSDRSAPRILGDTALPAAALDLAVADRLAVVADTAAGFTVLERSACTALAVVAETVPLGGAPAAASATAAAR